jgi:hypothetical protein
VYVSRLVTAAIVDIWRSREREERGKEKLAGRIFPWTAFAEWALS